MADSSLFLILGRSRTGSNMLVRLLNQHPEILCEGEIFRTVEAETWPTELQRLRRSPVPWSGFKMFYYHAAGDDGRLWDHLVADEEIPVVHLRRRNILRTATSRKLALGSDAWVEVKRGEDQARQKKAVRFDAEELRRDFETTRRFEGDFSERFEGHPRLDVEYTEFAADPFATCLGITEMLGISPLPGEATVTTRKQNPESLSELIANFAELKDEFAGTEWAEFFSIDDPTTA